MQQIFDRQQSKAQVQEKLKALAEEISDSLSTLDCAQRKEVLSEFVSDLFLAAADQQRREERRRRQAEGIAAAKARGVHFGPSAKPTPENFDEIYRAWRSGELSLRQAAGACGMARGTFCNIAMRREQTEDQTA